MVHCTPCLGGWVGGAEQIGLIGRCTPARPISCDNPVESHKSLNTLNTKNSRVSTTCESHSSHIPLRNEINWKNIKTIKIPGESR